jgi:ribosome-binding protein aMBF1 (putative translation factor)
MKCQRCGNDKEAEFRVVSDVLDIKVCADCAGEARSLGMSVEVVEIDKAKNERVASKAEARGYPVVTVSGAH